MIRKRGKMMLKKSLYRIWIVVIVLVLSFSMVIAQEKKDDPYNDGSGNLIFEDEKVSDRDFLFAGSNVSVRSIFDTTTFFAGNTINLDGQYNGDVFVGGNNVTINGKINGNLYAAGNVIILNGEVSQDVFVTGSDFTVSSTAEVKRDVFVASAIASFDGTIGRNLRVGAGNMLLNGRVGGFVETDVDHLTINDKAEVLGEIDHRSSSQAVVSNQANVGEINWQKVEISQKAEEAKSIGIGSIILSLIRKIAFILIIWLFLTFFSQEFTGNMETIVKKHIWASLGLGVAYLFLAPIIILLTLLLYLPLGIATALLIIASFILAMPIAAVAFSNLMIPIFEKKMKTRLASFLAILSIALAIVLIGYIPYLGGILSFMLMIFGTGFFSYNILFAKRLVKKEMLEHAKGFEKNQSDPSLMDAEGLKEKPSKEE